MFKVEKSPEINWPVTVSIPRDGGITVKAVFTGKFKVLTAVEFSAIYASGGNDEDLIRIVMTGWGADVLDAAGEPMEFNEGNLSQLVAMPFVRNAIVAAYLELSQGNKAARKN